jgi:hypothetical protein
MKKFNLIWSIIWGFLSACVFSSFFVIYTTSVFELSMPLICYQFIKFLFFVSAFLWLGSVAFLFYDIFEKKKKTYFKNQLSLIVYCILSITVGLLIFIFYWNAY